MTVLVSMPYWGCQETVRNAVESVLNQRYRDLVLLVLNDGDASSVEALDGIRDERLKVFDLKKNRGRFFADQVALTANPYDMFATHDADDWASPLWLLRLAEKVDSGFDAAYSACYHYSPIGRSVQDLSREAYTPLTKDPKHIANHPGVFRTEALRKVGGFHPDFRVGYDSLVPLLLKLTGKTSYDSTPLYHYHYRDDSLTKHPDTNAESSTRKQAVQAATDLYKKCWNEPNKVGQIIRDSVFPDTAKAVQSEAARLKEEMGW